MNQTTLSPLRKACMGLLCMAAGALSALCFVIGQEGYTGISALPAASTSYLWSALALCFGLMYHRVYHQKGLRADGLSLLFGLLFGELNAFCGVLFACDSWQMGRLTLCLHGLRGVGQGLPMTAFLVWLQSALQSSRADDGLWQPRRGQRVLAFCRRHELLCLMGLMVLCWSPYLVAFCPGTVCWDLGEMIAQFFGQREMDTWHPVFLTWVFGSLVWLGRLMGSDNIGAALFTLLQTVALSYALARSLRFMRQQGANRLLRLAALAFFALVPIWGGYAQFISKDTLYTAVLLLFFLCAADLLLGRVRRGLWAQLFAWGLLTCLIRSNGLYVIAPTALALICLCRGHRLPASAALCGALACALLFANVLVPALGIRDETASGLYSVCFQQSARILRDHADTVTPEEYAEIDLVLDAENLPDKYEPWISDPVKFTFRQYGQGAEKEKQALSRYRQTWLEMLQKYPLTCAEAFFAGNMSYYTFQPKIEGETYNNQAGNRLVFETYSLGPDERLLHTEQSNAFYTLRLLLAGFARGWRHIPLLGMLYVCPVYTWTLVGAALSLLRQKKARLLAAFLPALLTLGVCMLGPVNDYFRYFLPIVAMTPALLALCCKKA